MAESTENTYKNIANYGEDVLPENQKHDIDTEEYSNSNLETSPHCSEGSTSSIGSGSSTDMQEDDDDASSLLTPTSFLLSSSPSGPLYELSELMSELPIKRGLSRFYQGKSQSFTSLSSVRCVEDIPKKVTAFKRSRHKLYSNRRVNKAARSEYIHRRLNIHQWETAKVRGLLVDSDGVQSKTSSANINLQ